MSTPIFCCSWKPENGAVSDGLYRGPVFSKIGRRPRIFQRDARTSAFDTNEPVNSLESTGNITRIHHRKMRSSSHNLKIPEDMWICWTCDRGNLFGHDPAIFGTGRAESSNPKSTNASNHDDVALFLALVTNFSFNRSQSSPAAESFELSTNVGSGTGSKIKVLPVPQ